MSDHETDEGGTLYGIRKYMKDDDYPDWQDYDRWDPAPTRYASLAAAKAFVEEKVQADYRWHKERYDREIARWTPLKERYDQRKAVLEEAGLWIVDGEMSPLVLPGWTWGVPANDPKPDYSIWRIVSDADMDYPSTEPDWWSEDVIIIDT